MRVVQGGDRVDLRRGYVLVFHRHVVENLIAQVVKTVIGAYLLKCLDDVGGGANTAEFAV